MARVTSTTDYENFGVDTDLRVVVSCSIERGKRSGVPILFHTVKGIAIVLNYTIVVEATCANDAFIVDLTKPEPGTILVERTWERSPRDDIRSSHIFNANHTKIPLTIIWQELVDAVAALDRSHVIFMRLVEHILMVLAM